MRGGWRGEVYDLSQLGPFFVGHDLHPAPCPCWLWVYRDPWSSFALPPVVVPVPELVPLLLFCCFGSFCHRAVGQGVSWAPTVASLTEVVRAVSVEVSRFLTLRATTVRRGGQRVGGRGVASWVWLISGALAPCPVTVNMRIKLLEVVNNASSCKAGVDEVRDKEFFRHLRCHVEWQW